MTNKQYDILVSFLFLFKIIIEEIISCFVFVTENINIKAFKGVKVLINLGIFCIYIFCYKNKICANH